jgi:ABC-type nickel/cobalt efflux system permease component RcnA
MLEEILVIVLRSVVPFLVGSVGVWLYYRNKFTEVLTELEDKKVIIKTIHEHADEIERHNVKKVAKEHNAKVSKATKKEKTVEKPKRKYKKQSI